MNCKLCTEELNRGLFLQKSAKKTRMEPYLKQNNLRLVKSANVCYT